MFGISQVVPAIRSGKPPLLVAGTHRRKTAVHPLVRRATAQKTRRLFCPTSQARCAKIYIFPKDRTYDLKKPARLDTGDVLAIRHQT
jgi:hypothetical protein